MKLRLPLVPAVALALVLSGASVARAQAVGCTADATKSLVREFVGDYNTGRVAAMDRLWAPAPRFQWYSTGAPGRRLGPAAYDRTTLAAYFRARVRAREHIRLLDLRAGYDAGRNIVHFSGRLVRSANDITRPTRLDFKGAADCESLRSSLIVWSM